MAVNLKDQFFTPDSIDLLAQVIRKQYPPFDYKLFRKLVFNAQWGKLELKARMHHVSDCLHTCLPDDYISALVVLVKAAPEVKGFEGMVLPDYVEKYGMDHWEESLNALGHFTRFSSSEFAIRPFLDKDPDQVMKYMMIWAESKHENVRRLASEGCRPRLPWAMILPKFIVDPGPVLEVLEKLKDDPSLFVRKSVANNLNDISKDHPDLVLEVAVRWYGYSDRTNWIIKHGLRTLLKKGNPRALTLFGLSNAEHLDVMNFRLNRNKIKYGESLDFSFYLQNSNDEAKKVRLEYVITLARAAGKFYEKVFQIAERELQTGKTFFKRRYSFIDMTTRKHYPGKHSISIVVNGERKAHKKFVLTS